MTEVVNEHPQCYPDMPETPDGTVYRPSNGTEGEYFYEGWCAHCKRDATYREKLEDGCDILARSLAFNVKDDGYPVEWIWQKGRPVCTGFDDEALQITLEERAAQIPLL